MTRFRKKYVIYLDCKFGDKLFCEISRDFSSGNVLIKVAYLCDVYFDSMGDLNRIDQIDFQHICSLSSWQQYINRQFPGTRFKKLSEEYIF